MQALRRILGIRWYDKVSNAVVNERTKLPDILSLIADRHSSSFISGFGIYGAAVVPDSGIGNTWQRLTLVLHEFLSNWLTPSRLHIVISFLTHADVIQYLVTSVAYRRTHLLRRHCNCQ